MEIKCYTFAGHLLEPSEQSPPSARTPKLFYTIKSRLKCWLFSNWTAAEQMSIKVASHVRLHSFTTGHLYHLLTRWTAFNLPQNMMVWLRGKKQWQKHNKTKNQNRCFDVVWKISRRELAEANATKTSRVKQSGVLEILGGSGMAASERLSSDSTRC